MKRLVSIVVLLVMANSAYMQINEAFKFKVSSPFNHTDETVLRFHQDATTSFDGMWDAWKMFTWNDSVPSLFSNTSEDGMLSINSIDFPLKDTSMILEMKVPMISGVYTFETEALGQLPANLRLAIKDLENGVSHSIEDGATFSFNVTADPVNMIDRFELFISTDAYAVVDSTDATVFNEGCTDWNLTLLNESNVQVLNEQLSQESLFIDTLSAGWYTGIVVDSYGITDTVSFEILAQEEDEEEGGDEEIGEESDKFDQESLTVGVSTQADIQVVYEYGNAVVIAKDTQLKVLKVYSSNGSLIEELKPLDDERIILKPYVGITLVHVIHEHGEVVLKNIK